MGLYLNFLRFPGRSRKCFCLFICEHKLVKFKCSFCSEWTFGSWTNVQIAYCLIPYWRYGVSPSKPWHTWGMDMVHWWLMMTQVARPLKRVARDERQWWRISLMAYKLYEFKRIRLCKYMEATENEQILRDAQLWRTKNSTSCQLNNWINLEFNNAKQLT